MFIYFLFCNVLLCFIVLLFVMGSSDASINDYNGFHFRPVNIINTNILLNN